MDSEILQEKQITEEVMEQPFVLIDTSVESIPDIKIKNGKIFVNNSELSKYGYVSYLQKQGNGIYGFHSSLDENGDSIRKIFIDPENPDRNFSFIDLNTKNNNVFVKDFHWNSLDGKRTFSEGILASVDPITESVVFRTKAESFDDKNEVIVNNIPWKNKFNEILFAESYNDKVLVIAKKRDGKRDLFINDDSWSWPAHTDVDVNEKESVTRVATNGAGTVVVVVSSKRASKEDEYFEHIFVGDEKGARKEWKNVFDQTSHGNLHKIAIDKSLNNVAIVGMIDGIPTLVVNDIVCKLSSEPHIVEKLRVENGEVFIQYMNAIGKKFAEKVSLLKDAHQIQLHKIEFANIDEKLSKLRKIIHLQGLTPESVFEKLESFFSLKNEFDAEKEKTKNYLELRNTNNLLHSEKEYLGKILRAEKDKKAELEIRLKDANEMIRRAKDILHLYKPSKGKWSNKSKIHEEVYREMKSALGDTVIEENNIPEVESIRSLVYKEDKKEESVSWL